MSDKLLLNKDPAIHSDLTKTDGVELLVRHGMN